MHNKTIAELAEGLRSRQYSSRELTEVFLSRIRQHQKLNAYITVTEDVAMQQADAADARISKGDSGPLVGIPIAHKDIFCTDGVKTSCGSRMLDNFIAPYECDCCNQFAKGRYCDARQVEYGRVSHGVVK